jgi:hypothetical protein
MKSWMNSSELTYLTFTGVEDLSVVPARLQEGCLAAPSRRRRTGSMLCQLLEPMTNVSKVYSEPEPSATEVTDVNGTLTVSLLASVVPYSSDIQQPVRATATMDGHQHTHQAAPFGRDQGRAGSLHPEGQCSVDQTWTERQVCC